MITVTPALADTVRNNELSPLRICLGQRPDGGVDLSVTSCGTKQPGDLMAHSNGIHLLLDKPSQLLAGDGITIGYNRWNDVVIVPQPDAPAPAGCIKNVIRLHTRIAVELWVGRDEDEGKKKIVGISQFLSRLAYIDTLSKTDAAAVGILTQVDDASTSAVIAIKSIADAISQIRPPQDNVPGDAAFEIDMGYTSRRACLLSNLLVDFDRVVMLILAAHRAGKLDNEQRTAWLKDARRPFNRVFAITAKTHV